MSKRTSFATLLSGQEEKPPAAAPPQSILLHTVAGNPDNPRDPEELDLDELVAGFREVGQLQPVIVVSRDVYLRHVPHNEAAIGSADYVVLGGNRRLEAARALEWTRLDVVVRDDLGDGEGALDEATIIENIHRKNLAPLREAAFLQRMVDRHGSQSRVAERIGKTQAYVSQRLALLRLDPELREALDSGGLKVKDARRLAAIEDPDEQRAAWKAEQRAAAADPAPTHNPVMTPAGEAPAPPSPAAPPRPRSPQGVRAAGPDAVRMPWDDPAAVQRILLEHMSEDRVRTLAGLLRTTFPPE